MEQNYWNKTFDKNKKYIWISERGKTTCEKCQSLNGKIFSGDKVPNRPHPNCKCEVEEYHGTTIQNAPQETHNTDNPKEIQKLEKQANDLEKQVIILRGEIQKANRIEAVYSYKKMYEQKIKELFDTKSAINNLKQIKQDILTNIENAYIDNRNNVVSNTNQLKKIMFYKEMKQIPNDKKGFDDYIKKRSVIFKNAGALWDISSSKFTSEDSQKYIKENGLVVPKVSDLNNKNLERFIRRKLNEQINVTESIGILFNVNSSLSKKIEEDKNFIKKIQEHSFQNRNKLIFKGFAKNTSLIRFSDDDLYFALGKVDVINIHLDDMDNLWMLIVDTYDFNKNDPLPLVQKARRFQEQGLIENYYSIIPVKIPPEKWKTF